MTNTLKRIGWTLLLACSFAVSLASAEHQKVVGGMVINIGVVPADKLSAFPAEAAHENKLPAGSQHLLVSVSDARTGAHPELAGVVAEVIDPKGKVQKKALVLGKTAGIADHSEIFHFGWSGKYRIRVTVQPREGNPVRAEFAWAHAI